MRREVIVRREVAASPLLLRLEGSILAGIEVELKQLRAVYFDSKIQACGVPVFFFCPPSFSSGSWRPIFSSFFFSRIPISVMHEQQPQP